MLCIYIKLTQQFIEPSIFSFQSMSENPLVYHEQFILKIGASRHIPFLLRRKLGRILKLTSYLSYRNELTPRKGFVTIQATPHRNVWVGSWSYFKKYNNIPSLHMYRFIIKAPRPAIFLRFAHLYTKYVQFINLCLRYVYSAHNQNPIARDILNKS